MSHQETNVTKPEEPIDTEQLCWYIRRWFEKLNPWETMGEAGKGSIKHDSDQLKETMLLLTYCCPLQLPNQKQQISDW